MAALALIAAALGLQADQAAAAQGSSALLAFLPGQGQRSFEQELQRIGGLSLGVLSATQGNYTTAQLSLDITQGARVSYSAYSPPLPPALSLHLGGAGRGAQIEPWQAVLRRARSAPQLLQPGLLASQLPGGGAYAGIAGQQAPDSAVAADEQGHIETVSVGPTSTLVARIAALNARSQMIVADLPAGAQGFVQLRQLVKARAPGRLLIVVQSATQSTGSELLWVALAGPSYGGSTLSSQTTNERGLLAAIDIGPTILAHLGLPIPADMRGRPIRPDGPLDGPALRGLRARLLVIDSRRLPALAWLALGWALLLGAMTLPRGGDRPRRASWALRVGALSVLWAPFAVLIPAALEPARAAEFALIVLACFTLGALSDRLLPWPRAPALVALVVVAALTIDALAGTQLFVRSLLGPKPAFGARFYGIGNELKSGLAVLVFAGVAAALYPAVRGWRAALTMAFAGVALAVVEGSARIGAGVGGVILVSAGTAVATVLLAPGAINRRRVLLVMAAPVIGLVALALLDLASANGSGHFTGSVLDARSASDIKDIIVRRYGAAWDELRNHLMPLASALALMAAGFGIARRERLCAPVSGDPAWLAALSGGLTAGVVGALSEDSGPVLLVVAVGVLGCVIAYLWGRPVPRAAGAQKSAPVSVLQTPEIQGSLLK